MTSDDTLNGAKIIIEEMEDKLKNKKLPEMDKMYIRANVYQLRLMSTLRKDVELLKKHDILSWVQLNPKLTLVLLVFVFVGIQKIDWMNLLAALFSGAVKI